MSPMPAYGFEERVQLGIEKTYALDAVGPTTIQAVNEFKPENWGVQITDEAVANTPSPGSNVRFHYGDSVVPCPTEFKEIPDVSGSFEFNMGFDTIGWFLANAVFGDPAMTNVQEGGFPTHTHTFEWPTDTSRDMPDSLFMRRIFGEGTVDHRGGYCNTFMIIGEANRLIRVDAGLAFSLYNNYFTGAPPALTVPVICASTAFLHSAELFWDPDPLLTSPLSVGNIHDFTFGIENNLRLIPAAGFAARGHRRPIPDGFRRFYLDFNTDAEDFSNADRWSNMWEVIGATGYGSFRLVIDTGIVIPGGGALTYKLTIEMDAARVLGDATVHPGSEGPVPETVRIEAGAITVGGTDQMGRIIVQNGVDEDTWQNSLA